MGPKKVALRDTSLKIPLMNGVCRRNRCAPNRLPRGIPILMVGLINPSNRTSTIDQNYNVIRYIKCNNYNRDCNNNELVAVYDF